MAAIAKRYFMGQHIALILGRNAKSDNSTKSNQSTQGVSI